MMLLFGVAIFSFIMDKFIEMLHLTKQFNRSLDDGDNLSRFFGVCERFNDYKPLDLELKRKIESYFKFKWMHDKNQALRDKDDLEIFDQIPDEIQDNVYEKFLYSDFLADYRKYFIFEKKFSEHRHNYYSWKDN